jgi:Rhodopirellula transposase DDE domain
MNWRGRPLTSIRTIIELIFATTNQTGLTVAASYDPNWYATGIKITDIQNARHTPHPTTGTTPSPPDETRHQSRGEP